MQLTRAHYSSCNRLLILFKDYIDSINFTVLYKRLANYSAFNDYVVWNENTMCVSVYSILSLCSCQWRWTKRNKRELIICYLPTPAQTCTTIRTVIALRHTFTWSTHRLSYPFWTEKKIIHLPQAIANVRIIWSPCHTMPFKPLCFNFLINNFCNLLLSEFVFVKQQQFIHLNILPFLFQSKSWCMFQWHTHRNGSSCMLAAIIIKNKKFAENLFDLNTHTNK